MSKYVCQICGYIYDEENEAVKFDDLPADWTCPLCGASKDMFEISAAIDEIVKEEKTLNAVISADEHSDGMRKMTANELAAIFSSLARGCEKQYKAEESKLFNEIAAYYTMQSDTQDDADLTVLTEKIKSDLENEYAFAQKASEEVNDRGAKRALLWSEKVTKIISSLLARYHKEGDAMLENTRIWVCDICGFIYVGDVPPAVCPVCKVPSFKILEVARV